MDLLSSALGNLGPDALKSLAPQIQTLFAQFISRPEAREKLQGLLNQFNIPLPVDQILAFLTNNGMIEEKGDQVKGTPALSELAGKLPELLGGFGGAGGLEELAKGLGGQQGASGLMKGLFG
ncbi:MAG: hypothetical protein H6686_12095 [Fibrobacteria bacterium]|nr:hypothetical protein [Fibrobacteria bacterium]